MGCEHDVCKTIRKRSVVLVTYISVPNVISPGGGYRYATPLITVLLSGTSAFFSFAVNVYSTGSPDTSSSRYVIFPLQSPHCSSSVSKFFQPGKADVIAIINTIPVSIERLALSQFIFFSIKLTCFLRSDLEKPRPPVKKKMYNPLEQLVQVPKFMAPERCVEIVAAANANGNWTTQRHRHYPTTDIPLAEISGISLVEELASIEDIARQAYALPDAKMTMFDLFVVKYEAGAQDQLALHRDVSVLSFVVLLNSPDEFEGGGTYYEAKDKTVPLGQGEVVIHCGKQRHAGCKVTAGIRYVLIGFIGTLDAAIAPLLEEEKDALNKISDKRFFEFLWRRVHVTPRTIAVRIINMDTRPVRYDSACETLNRAIVPPDCVVIVERLPASTGEGAVPYAGWVKENAAEVTTPACAAIVAPYWSRPIERAELGCSQSHLQAIQTCKADYLLVLEDDADYLSDLWYRIGTYLDELAGVAWDAIDLGAIAIDGHPFQPATASLGLRGYCYQTHCILYSSAGMAKIRALDPRVDVIPFDELLPALRRVHPRHELNALHPHVPALAVFFPRERLSGQKNDGVHDTGVNTELAVLTNNSTDLANYYIFWEVAGVADLQRLVEKANQAMWNFSITAWEPATDNTFNGAWAMDLTQAHFYRKVTAVYFSPVMAHGSVMEFHGGSGPRAAPIAPRSLVVFPSYLAFRISGAAVVIRACGNSFS